MVRTRDQITQDVEQLRSRRSYRTMIAAMRTLLLAMCSAVVAWRLQYTNVPKPIVATFLVASFDVAFCAGLVYTATAAFLAITQSVNVKARSIYNPTAQIEFVKAYFRLYNFERARSLGAPALS